MALLNIRTWLDKIDLILRMIFKYKEHNTFERRVSQANDIRTKRPDCVPVLLEKLPESTVPAVDNPRLLIPKDMSVAQFIWVIRRKIQLKPETALFLFVGKLLPQNSALMGQIYDEHRDEDGFLYVAYSSENTFGS